MLPVSASPEDMRADQHAADEEDDDLRNARAGQDGDQERRQRSHQRDRQQVIQPAIQVHDGHSADVAMVIRDPPGQ